MGQCVYCSGDVNFETGVCWTCSQKQPDQMTSKEGRPSGVDPNWLANEPTSASSKPKPTAGAGGPMPLPLAAAQPVSVIVGALPKWRALRTIATLFKVFAAIIAGVGVIGSVQVLSAAGSVGSSSGFGLLGLAGPIGALMILFWAGLVFLFLYGWAELILLLISIEQNTRKR